MSIHIRTLNTVGKNVWDNYVMGHPQGTVFHLSRWHEVIKESFGHKSHYFLATSDQAGKQPVGVLPIFRIKSLLFGDSLISIPFAETGGILADDEGIEATLLQKAKALAEEMKCDYLELRNRKPVPDLMVKDLYYNFTKEIDPDPEVNMKAIPKKARRMIRVGRKNGLSSEMGHHLLPEFYELMAMNYHRLGTPIFPKSYFRRFTDHFKDKCRILMVRSDEGKPIAGVISFFFKDQVLPYYAGSDFDYRRQAPNDFMYWELMEYGRENGYRWFDFGRSKSDTGSYHFKRHWGFEPVQLHYQYHLVNLPELPNLSPANPKYQKKIEIWKKMPLPVTKTLGPWIAKYLA